MRLRRMGGSYWHASSCRFPWKPQERILHSAFLPSHRRLVQRGGRSRRREMPECRGGGPPLKQRETNSLDMRGRALPYR